MWILIVEQGMPTVSWYAALALRRRVSMSAIGSVIVMAWWPSSPWFPCGPAAWSVSAGGAQVGRCPVVPGGSCWLSCCRLPTGLGDAGQFAAVGHGPETDPAQPEPLVHRSRAPAPRASGVAAHLELRLAVRLDDERLLRHWSVLLERESEPPQQRTALVIVGGGRDHGHVHPALAVHLVWVDLVEHELLGEAERVVPPAVELPVAQAPEVTDPGQRQREQPVEELPHPVAPQGHVRADRHALAQLELGDGLPRPGHGRLLAGDDGQVLHRALDELGVPRRLADPHVDRDLGQAWDLHHVGVAELLPQRGRDLGPVPLLQARLDPPGGRLLRCRCHQTSLPLVREIRTLARLPSPSSIR